MVALAKNIRREPVPHTLEEPLDAVDRRLIEAPAAPRAQDHPRSGVDRWYAPSMAPMGSRAHMERGGAEGLDAKLNLSAIGRTSGGLATEILALATHGRQFGVDRVLGQQVLDEALHAVPGNQVVGGAHR